MKQINEDIKQGIFKQIYLLYGEERYLRSQYRDRLQKALWRRRYERSFLRRQGCAGGPNY